MLKHSLLALTLAGLLSSVAPSSFAQDNGGNNANDQPATSSTTPDRGPQHGRFDPAKKTEMLTKHLNLNSDQQSKVLDILKSEQSQMENLRSDASVSQADRRPKMMSIRKASDDQIRAVLDSNQQQKFDAMQSRHERWQEHRSDAPGQNAPPSSE